MPFKK